MSRFGIVLCLSKERIHRLAGWSCIIYWLLKIRPRCVLCGLGFGLIVPEARKLLVFIRMVNRLKHVHLYLAIIGQRFIILIWYIGDILNKIA